MKKIAILSWFFQDTELTDIKSKSLNSKSAYALYAIDKKTDLSAVYNKLFTEVLKDIEYSAEHKRTEAYIPYPHWITEALREQCINDLRNLGYEVLYESEVSIIVSWKM